MVFNSGKQFRNKAHEQPQKAGGYEPDVQVLAVPPGSLVPGPASEPPSAAASQVATPNTSMLSASAETSFTSMFEMLLSNPELCKPPLANLPPRTEPEPEPETEEDKPEPESEPEAKGKKQMSAFQSDSSLVDPLSLEYYTPPAF